MKQTLLQGISLSLQPGYSEHKENDTIMNHCPVSDRFTLMLRRNW